MECGGKARSAATPLWIETGTARSPQRATEGKSEQPNYELHELHEKGIGQVGRTLRVSRDRAAGTADLSPRTRRPPRRFCDSVQNRRQLERRRAAPESEKLVRRRGISAPSRWPACGTRPRSLDSARDDRRDRQTTKHTKSTKGGQVGRSRRDRRDRTAEQPVSRQEREDRKGASALSQTSWRPWRSLREPSWAVSPCPSARSAAKNLRLFFRAIRVFRS